MTKNTWSVHFCLFCLNKFFLRQDNFTLIQLFPMCPIPFCGQLFLALEFVLLNSFSSNILRYYLPFPVARSSNFCCRRYLFHYFSNFLCIFWIPLFKSFVPIWAIKRSVLFFNSVLFMLVSVSWKLFIITLFSWLFS